MIMIMVSCNFLLTLTPHAAHTWSDAADELCCIWEEDPWRCRDVQRETIFADWDKNRRPPLTGLPQCICAYASVIALFWRCLFPVDAVEEPPSVSEQRDLGWFIQYWLNCFDLWPSSLYSRKVLRLKRKLLPLIVRHARTHRTCVPLSRRSGSNPALDFLSVLIYALWHLIFTLPSPLISFSNLSLSLFLFSLPRWSSLGTPHFLLTSVPHLTSPMSLLDQPL